jgi:hypothetical protein
MVKKINLNYDDEIFKKLQNDKKQLGVRKRLSLSWEEYFIMRCKIK